MFDCFLLKTTLCRPLYSETQLHLDYLATVTASLVVLQEAVGEVQPAKWKKKDNLPEVHSSYHNLMVKELMQDFAASVLQVISCCKIFQYHLNTVGLTVVSLSLIHI